MSPKKKKFAKRPVWDVPWTPFQPAHLNEAQKEKLLSVGSRGLPVAIFQNSRYEVWIYSHEPNVENAAERASRTVLELSIKRREKTPIRSWRDLQRIKNELCGEEREACEIFPAESRLVDTSNQYNLWVLPTGHKFPFGYQERLVMEGDSVDGAKQAPFEPGTRPADCVEAPKTREEWDKLARNSK